MRLLPVLILVCLVLVACAPKVDTAYASPSPNGLNGFSLITDYWHDHLKLEHLHRWGTLAEECQTVIHLEDESTTPLTELDEVTRDRLRAWLRQGHRQLILVLKDDIFSNWLIERWLADLQGLRQDATGPEAERLDDQMREYRRALRLIPPRATLGETFTILDYELTGITPLPPQTMTGVTPGIPPAGMVLRSIITDRRAQPLISFDEWIYAAEMPCYGSSRVIILTSAMPLFNAALVDPQARVLVENLTADIVARQRGRAAWVTDLRPLPPHPPPGILITLFLTPPFAIVSWHVLALLLLYAWFLAAAWLGRIEDDDDHHHLHDFSAHLEALGRRLRSTDRRLHALEAIAKALRIDPPTTSIDPVEEARQLILSSEPSTPPRKHP